ncbi:glycoside hydrolase family 13 protein [Oenococcus kitaharae]|uniref:Alpha-glucosidase n=1 Tax=Oenococcus kitaharae DSM 17330 TaxID=1045004 RepID=G9WFA1_9LACO|nr:alpha-glucosidase [Oenococcus kitaharae]EHN58821.1 Alpha-glucosidase [Oenococcus kitaharae DSM 17330]OEY81842.1 hypothetical protein NT96_08780 [Oenococcus kitaharae]OEY84072.1 hypothetical protein NT95_02840 [Oenococcus kitaharae]OEY85569.1 hypothetical protein NV75_03595 [Oenococcus kitaharae]
MTSDQSRTWWQNAIGYQIYPMSFQDSNNDGVGDLRGIIDRIDYIKKLGVDLVWLNPIYKSPKVDNGYDISDFTSIDPIFGSLSDFKELLAKLHKNNIHLIMDLVINHTSDQHRWFQEALKSRDNPYHDYYLWQDGLADQVPNDWHNWDGQSEWTFVPALKQWYFHIFNPKMPDLNWQNSKLRNEVISAIKWWLDLGIDGFRLDAISHLKKMPFGQSMSSISKENGGDPWRVHTNVTGLQEYLQLLKNLFQQYPIFTVGEANGVSASQAQLWTGSDGYFNSIFQLEQNAHDGIDSKGRSKGNFQVFKKTVFHWQNALRLYGWGSPYLSNHDTPRALQNWGDDKSAKSGKALATILLSLQGTPFIYFGDEIGIPSFQFKNIQEINDPEAQMRFKSELAAGKDQQTIFADLRLWNRDQSRTPFQWDDTKNAGFTTARPWIEINPSFTKINAATQDQQKNSLLNYYRRMVRLRHDQSALHTGEFTAVEAEDPQVMAFVRKSEKQMAFIFANLTDTPALFELPESLLCGSWRLLISNFPNARLSQQISLQPYDSAIFIKDLK